MLRLLSYSWRAKISTLFCPATRVKTKMSVAQRQSALSRACPPLVSRPLLLDRHLPKTW